MRTHSRHFTRSKRALVTGGGTGIGRGIALALARRGVEVALVGRQPAALNNVAGEITASGGQAVAVPADLADPLARASLRQQISSTLGPIDLLVNNAGVLAGGELGQLSATTIETALAINLAAPMILVQQFLPDLIAQQGTVVLVGSMMSFVPLPAASVYSATKAGLHAFGEALRYELQQHGIHLLTVYPPGTATAMTAPLARRSPWHVALADPEALGERIVRALIAGRRNVQWGAGERLLTGLYRGCPWLVRRVLAHYHAMFAHMFLEHHD